MTNMLLTLCRRFVERSDALGYKGVKQHNALMDYMAGAYVALDAAGAKKDADHIGAVSAMIFSTRGMTEVRVMLAKADAEAIQKAEANAT